MLLELQVRNLGVVVELDLVLDRGLTAFTGETGAGKTMIVEAIELLTGGRADTRRVRPGAEEAVVTGRFLVGDDEVILKRVVPATGRSRGYLDGEAVPVATLASWGERLVAQHGQHEHRSMASPAAQRDALDRFAGVDLAPLRDLRARLSDLHDRQRALGGDVATREREMELLRFQLEELDAVALEDPEEDERLATEQARLADVAGDRESGTVALGMLSDDDTIVAMLNAVIGHLGDRPRFAELVQGLRNQADILTDAGRELRREVEEIVDDPVRLDEIRERRQHLATLARKYGDGTVPGLVAARATLAKRLGELEDHDVAAARLAAEVTDLEVRRARLQEVLVSQRVAAAPELAGQIQTRLRALAMPNARMSVEVSADGEVSFLLGANPGTPMLPLGKVASGGELARTMLAVRLVLDDGPPLLVFDEVDAGIGGSAATAVGTALASLGAHRQVLVVTHLPQVAAAAHGQIGVIKTQRKDATVTTAERLTGEARVIELARMLSGQPDSATARSHARELLAVHSRGDADV